MGKPADVGHQVNRNMLTLSNVVLFIAIGTAFIGLASSFRLFPAINGVGSLILGVASFALLGISHVMDRQAKG